ncbi:MAG: YitT family protein [Ezakiella sp.]|nr:YitT family protein [Ezakiella sp.]
MKELELSKERISKLKKIRPKVTIKQALIMVIGVIMIAVAIHFFLLPNDLSLGGATGMALILSKITGISAPPLLIVANIVLFILGFVFIGNSFGVLTVIASIGLSGLVWLMDLVIPVAAPPIDNVFLSLITACILYGVGVGLVLNQNASTGGSDIISKILNKFFGLDLGKGCLITDLVITLFVSFSYGLEIALYCLVGVILTGVIVDYTIDGMNTSKLCYITTTQPEKICEFLISIGRSATIYEAKGAYENKDRIVIQTVINNRDLIRLRAYVKAVDTKVFMVVTNAHQVFGWHWKSIED